MTDLDVVARVDQRMITSLRESVKDCSERGLAFASKWSAELLVSIPAKKLFATPSIDPVPFTSTLARPRSSGSPTDPDLHLPPHPHAPRTQPVPESVRLRELELEIREGDFLTTALKCFEHREFPRAVYWLHECRSAKALFLSVYSQYMAAEKQALKEWNKYQNSRRQNPAPVTKTLLELLEMVKKSDDPFLKFLRGLLLYRLDRREEAIEAVILSIAGYPWNWSAWMLLGNCVEDSEELTSILQYLPLPRSHPLVQFFQIHTLNAFRSPTDHEVQLCDRLLTDDFFPVSPWVMSMRACALYHQHDFGEAEKQFQRILSVDPYRIDNIDIYSDILYVTDNRIKLSKLAHEYLELDKDRPEICCLVGNHYSLRAEHEKAIKYFRRAIQLDRTYLSAWTLMGHEYIEMKNSNAAIEAYRRAADVNQKDYRAWYGLAQAYELLSMHQYALYYFQKATTLRPYDVRLWQGQSACYEELGRPREAIECLKRALIATGPHDTTIHLKLAQFHNDLEEYAEAAKYHSIVIDMCARDNMPITDYSKSALYVAQYHHQHGGGNLKLAKYYLELLSTSNSEDVNTAQEMLKQVKLTIAGRGLLAHASPRVPRDAPMET